MPHRISRAALALGLVGMLPILASARAGSPPAQAPEPMVSLARENAVAAHVLRDDGALAGDTPLLHLNLVLRRPSARAAALDALMAEQLDPASPNFRRWVEPAAFGPTFGATDAQLDAVRAWLGRWGLQAGRVAPDRLSVAFTGTALRVNAAFRTEMHRYARPDGGVHRANAVPPAIPASLQAIVSGVTLSDFFPKPSVLRARPIMRRAGPAPAFNFSTAARSYYAVTPQDLAVIYNFNQARDGLAVSIADPATGRPGLALTGAGVTVVVAEQSNIRPADWSVFRDLTGLSRYPGTLTITHPGGCGDPGFTADETEAALDAEYASAAAPAAHIVVASCAAGGSGFGVMTALQNLFAAGPAVPVVSVSYAACEAANGAGFLQMWSNLMQQGAAQGTSIIVASGDSAVAACDSPGAADAAQGFGVNGLSATPYALSAGGTDFSDLADNRIADFWSPTVMRYGLTARSAIPEIPWDNSCAGSVGWKYLGAADAIASCNAPGLDHHEVVGGGGGPSAVFAKPAWQAGVPGIPADGRRGQPDVSLFAANGLWSHLYLYCMSDTAQGGTPCTYDTPAAVLGNAAGGTSFVAPILAGVQAMVIQARGGLLVGNPAPRYYQIAAGQFSYPQLVDGCRSGLAPRQHAACVFNVVTRGDTAVLCRAGSPDCVTSAASTAGFGVLATGARPGAAAYAAANGWSFATGLGSLNVTNLVVNY